MTTKIPLRLIDDGLEAYIISIIEQYLGVSDEGFGLDADYFVSASTGSDSNDGLTYMTPKATLSAITALNPAAGSVIGLKAGETYYETLSVSSSGNSNSPIKYAAYGSGDKPVIDGTSAITEWSLYSGNIYRAPIETAVTQLFVDGEFLLVSRYPQTGYAPVTTGGSGTTFTASSLSDSYDYTGATVYHKIDGWTLRTATVSSYSGNTITTSALPYSNTYDVDWGVFMVNALDFMTYAGSWYYDSEGGYIYLWMPDSSNPALHNIRGSVRQCVDIGSNSYVTLENISIKGSNDRGITSSTGANYITIDKCEISYSTDAGIRLADGTDGHIFTGNSVSYSGTDGIKTTNSDNVTASYNTVTDSGMLSYIGLGGFDQQEGVGISIQGSTDGTTYISHNVITNCGYSGIMGSGTVEYNYVDGVCLTIDDGGGFYASGNYPIVQYNIFKNILGNTDGEPSWDGTPAYGVYFDDNNVGGIARGNVIYLCGHGGVYLHNTTNAQVLDNYIYNAQACIMVISASNSGNVITGNTIVKSYEKSASEGGPMLIYISNLSTVATCDNNTFYNESNQSYFQDANGLYWSLAGWQASYGFDTNSSYYSTDYGTLELYYNETESLKAITLTGTYYNIDGTTATSFNLQPFTGKVVINAA